MDEFEKHFVKKYLFVILFLELVSIFLVCLIKFSFKNIFFLLSFNLIIFFGFYLSAKKRIEQSIQSRSSSKIQSLAYILLLLLFGTILLSLSILIKFKFYICVSALLAHILFRVIFWKKIQIRIARKDKNEEIVLIVKQVFASTILFGLFPLFLDLHYNYLSIISPPQITIGFIYGSVLLGMQIISFIMIINRTEKKEKHQE